MTEPLVRFLVSILGFLAGMLALRLLVYLLF